MGAGRFKVPSLRGQKRQSAQEAKALGLELREAVKRRDPETARTLIYRGANVNAVPFIGALRALAFPSGDGDAQMTKLLLANGADHRSRTQAMIWAARMGRIDIVKLLLDYGANPNNADCDGLTPLYWARKNGRREIIQCLEEAGARDQ